jgi:hypothetical protein
VSIIERVVEYDTASHGKAEVFFSLKDKPQSSVSLHPIFCHMRRKSTAAICFYVMICFIVSLPSNDSLGCQQVRDSTA